MYPISYYIVVILFVVYSAVFYYTCYTIGFHIIRALSHILDVPQNLHSTASTLYIYYSHASSTSDPHDRQERQASMQGFMIRCTFLVTN